MSSAGSRDPATDLQYLTWNFMPYICDRKLSVNCGGLKSFLAYALIGVPQGSVLGPILFVLYTKQCRMVIYRNIGDWFLDLEGDRWGKTSYRGQNKLHLLDRLIYCVWRSKTLLLSSANWSRSARPHQNQQYPQMLWYAAVQKRQRAVKYLHTGPALPSHHSTFSLPQRRLWSFLRPVVQHLATERFLWLPHVPGTLCRLRCEQSSHWRRSGAD